MDLTIVHSELLWLQETDCLQHPQRCGGGAGEASGSPATCTVATGYGLNLHACVLLKLATVQPNMPHGTSRGLTAEAE